MGKKKEGAKVVRRQPPSFQSGEKRRKICRRPSQTIQPQSGSGRGRDSQDESRLLDTPGLDFLQHHVLHPSRNADEDLAGIFVQHRRSHRSDGERGGEDPSSTATPNLDNEGEGGERRRPRLR
jgi:hypothetical protein